MLFAKSVILVASVGIIKFIAIIIIINTIRYTVNILNALDFFFTIFIFDF